MSNYTFIVNSYPLSCYVMHILMRLNKCLIDEALSHANSKRSEMGRQDRGNRPVRLKAARQAPYRNVQGNQGDILGHCNCTSTTWVVLCY